MASLPSDQLVVDSFTVDLIQGGSGRYRVLAVVLDNVNDFGGVLGDIVRTTWETPGRPGLFETIVRWSREWDVETADTIAFELSQIDAIYAL